MQKNKPPCILVFDSGVGGLSVFREIQRQHPHCSFSYVCDNAAFPYGKKPATELIDRVEKVLHQIQHTAAADIIVIACNSASTLALPRIRKQFLQPVVGVVPAIKPASELSKTKVIGLLATPGTIKRQYTKNLIDQFAKNCEIISVGSSQLVDLAEAKLRNLGVSTRTLSPILEPFKENNQLDTLVLACTHFPLLLPELQATLPQVQHWVDSADAIGRRVGHWLKQQNLTLGEHTMKKQPKHTVYFTAGGSGLNLLRPLLTEWQLNDIRIVKI